LKVFKVDLAAKTLETIVEVDAHDGDVNCVKFAGSDLLATCSDDMKVKIWRLL